MKCDDSLMQKINEEADLLQIASEDMTLEKMGNDYFGCCPFHVDKTPSFSITPGKNKFICFSCKQKGGVIGYLMKVRKLTMDKAIEVGAKYAGIDTNNLCKSETVLYLRHIKREREINASTQIEHEILPESTLNKLKKEIPQEWLDEGIDADVMKLFEVAIDDWNNRIVYSVRDIDGNLINIKGRTRYQNYKILRIPKYMNSYKIGVMDYLQGLNITKEFVAEKKEIIIFESIKSVMKIYGWGYKNSASAEKHVLTIEQIMLIIRLGCDVVFAYDSDIDYNSSEVKSDIDKLKRVTNVFLIEDKDKLLGGENAKNSPADCGREVWEKLYAAKRKVI